MNDNPKKDEEKKENDISSYLKYSHLGIQFIITIGIFLAIGYFIDDLLGTYPIIFAISVFPGFCAAYYLLYRELIPPKK